MASRPSTVPQLDTNQTNRTIPAPSKVTDGYVLNDTFPAANANYLFGWAGDWLEWLDERTEDGATPTTDFTLRGLDALTVTGDGGVLTLKGGDGGATSGDGGDIILLPGGVTSGTRGYVGIDETNPVANLHITSASYPTLRIESTDATEGPVLYLIDATAHWEMYLYDDDLHFWDTQNRVTFQAGGNVGIGQGNPDTLLHLYGTAPDIKFQDTVGDTWLAGNSDGSFRIYNVTDTRFGLYIDGNGLAAIGNTSSPLGTLHVWTSDIGSWTPNTAYDDLIVENSGWAGISIAHSNTQGGTLAFCTVDGNSRASLEYDANNDNVYLWHWGGKYFNVNAAGFAFNSTNPLGTVHIQTASAGSIAPSSSYDDLVVESSLNTGISIYSGTANVGGVIFGDADGDVRGGMVYDHGAALTDALQLYTSGGARVTIDSAGKVGINTTPSYRLHVSDDASGPSCVINNTATSYGNADPVLYVRQSGDTSHSNAVGVFGVGNSDDSGLDGNLLRVTQTGWVVMGATTPGAKLHVTEDAASVRVRVESTSTGGTNTPGFMMYNETSFEGGIIYVEARDTVEIFSGFDATYGAIKIDATNDNVGIGLTTASPDTLLHLYGSSPDITYEDTSGDKFLAGNNDGAFRVRNVTDGRTDFSIDGDGKTGFNEATPLGFVHIRKADAGSVTVSNDGDELIIENSTNAGLSIVCPDSYTGFIVFTNQSDVSAGVIKYIHTSDKMEFQVNNGNTALSLYSAGEVYAPFIYSDDIVAKTPLALYVGSDGQIGISSSTVRNKTNIADLADVDWLYDLRPIEFEPKKADGTGTGERRMGLLAEEVEKVKQSLCFYERENGGRVQGIHYLELITPILKALQQQRETIASLSARLQAANL